MPVPAALTVFTLQNTAAVATYKCLRKSNGLHAVCWTARTSKQTIHCVR